MPCCSDGGAKVSIATAEDEDGVPQQTDADKQHPDNKMVTLDPEFGGPCKKRRCTDVLCVLMLISCWVVMTAIGWAALGWIPSDRINKGNPWRLVNGIDYKGQICGIGKDVKSKDKMYYMPDGQGVCVKKCPGSTKIDSFVCRYNQQDELDSEADDATRLALGYRYVKNEKCSLVYETTDILNYCVSDSSIDFASELAGSSEAQAAFDASNANSTANFGYESKEKKEWHEKLYGDVWVSLPYILGLGIGGALLVGFVYTFLLRIPGVLALIIWGLIFAIFLVFVVSGALCYKTHKDWSGEDKPRTHTKTQADAMLYICYACLAGAGLWFCFICCIRKRIMLAIGIVREAAKAIAAMPAIVIFPVVQCFGLVVFLVPWICYSMFLASSGDVKTKTGGATGQSYKEVHYDKNTYYAGWYMLFSYYWTSEFIVAIGQIIVAMAVSTWYFSRDKSTIGNLTLLTSIRKSVKYHTGTAAFGSLIIAIIKTIRAIVAYIQKKANKMKTCRALVQVLLCVIQCCLWCIEKCMKFINKNAYIQTAIFGYSFCKAARCAFFLILRNLIRIMALGIVAGFVLLLGKIIIAGGATFLCYVVLVNSPVNEKLSGVYVPLILTFFVALYIATMFNEVWGMAMDTILQCFVADEEMFDSDKEAMYAGNSLKSCISNSHKGDYAKKNPRKIAPEPTSTPVESMEPIP